MSSFKFTEHTIPDALTDCVKNSVLSTFSNILGSQTVYSGNGNNGHREIQGDGVIGIISFIGDITWLLMLELPRKSAKGMAAKFCGFEIEFDSPDMGDVVGELANVLAGDIVGRLSAEGIKVSMSLPTIMRGQNVEPMVPRGVSSKEMRFSAPEGDFRLQLAGTPPGEFAARRPGT